MTEVINNCPEDELAHEGVDWAHHEECLRLLIFIDVLAPQASFRPDSIRK